MAVEIYTIIYHHRFDHWTRLCGCGEGPLTPDEYKTHYDGLDEEERYTTIPGMNGFELLIDSLEGPT